MIKSDFINILNTLSTNPLFMTKQKYPIKKVAIEVKMRCSYYPDGYKRCTNVATIVKDSNIGEGKQVLAYCESCFRDYQIENKEQRRMHID